MKSFVLIILGIGQARTGWGRVGDVTFRKGGGGGLGGVWEGGQRVLPLGLWGGGGGCLSLGSGEIFLLR